MNQLAFTKYAILTILTYIITSKVPSNLLLRCSFAVFHIAGSFVEEMFHNFTDRLRFVETFPTSILLYYVLVFTWPRGRKAPKIDKLAKQPRGHVITGLVQMTGNNVYLNSFAVKLICPSE